MDHPPLGIERFRLLKDELGVFCRCAHPLAANGKLGLVGAESQKWISLGRASPFDHDVRKMLTAVGDGTTRTEIAILGQAFMLMRILAECRHLSVLPNFPVRMLQSHFPLVTLSLQVKPTQRNIYLWCRTTQLEDPAFVEVKEAILEYAVKL